MIISLAQYKGGVGKTTSAICLATLLSRQGKTLLIDADPNRSATLWARKGKLPFTVCTDSEAARELMRGGYAHTVIDTAARPSSDDIAAIANGADLLICPATPDPLSLAALVQLTTDLPTGTNYRCLVTMAPPSPQTDGADAIAALVSHGLPVFARAIRRYKAYIKAADAGVIVEQAQGGGVAWHDWQAVWGEINGKVG